MKPHTTNPRSRSTANHSAFELKQRLALALNKLADRDTQQIGMDELERTAETLTPDGIPPFLSCVAETLTSADQKPAVRRECVRSMAALARIHGHLLSPHLSKMVASLVKRLKDPDSVVRDACVETAGALARHVRGSGGDDGGGSVFVAVARPIFEALGEQNRYVQAGSAMCLARVIDESVDPPPSIFPQMLTRVVKLLKNPHFMAKPAVIELIRSIVQAGDVSKEHTLSAAVSAILEALKSNDWTTRKAASVALADIAVTIGSSLGPFKSSCIQSLECCRFDKVKPVRDAVIHAIQCWKTLQGTHSPEPSEAGSSTKENFGSNYPGISSKSEGGWRESSFRKPNPVSTLSGNTTSSKLKRTPLTVRRTCPSSRPNRQHEQNDSPFEISVPKSCTTPIVDSQFEESGGSCISKPYARTAYATRGKATKYDYDPTNDKPECSSISDLVSVSFETKHVTASHGCNEEGDSEDRMNQRSDTEDVDPEYFRLQNAKSLDSTVTYSCPRDMHGRGSRAANELTFIRKQLLVIETRQSNLMDLLQVFMGDTMDSLSTLQLKLHSLEHTVDKITQGFAQTENYHTVPGPKLMKKNQSVSSSPRISTCTPRPSVDASYRRPST